MTDTEAIQAVRDGNRAEIVDSIHPAENPASALCLHSYWRSIACDGETDVVECASCGRQRLAKCDFNEEYS